MPLAGIVMWYLLPLAIFALGAVKAYLALGKTVYGGKERMDGKTVIVTGGSSGIGAEAAKDLARRGSRVLIVSNRTKDGERIKEEIIAETGNRNIVVKFVDFASLASVRRCAEEILNEESRIDVLLNNAGAGCLGHNEITADGLEVIMQINYFGPFLFTNLLLERMKSSSPARIVNVTSIFHMFGWLNLNDLNMQRNVLTRNLRVANDILAYSNSKLAVNLFTLALAEKLEGTGVTVNCVHPGAIKTTIADKGNFLSKSIFNIIVWFYSMNAWEGAQTSIFLCVSPSVDNVSGKYFSACREAISSWTSRDKTLARDLWGISERAVQLRGN